MSSFIVVLLCIVNFVRADLEDKRLSDDVTIETAVLKDLSNYLSASLYMFIWAFNLWNSTAINSRCCKEQTHVICLQIFVFSVKLRFFNLLYEAISFITLLCIVSQLYFQLWDCVLKKHHNTCSPISEDSTLHIILHEFSAVFSSAYQFPWHFSHLVASSFQKHFFFPLLFHCSFSKPEKQCKIKK